MTPELMEIIASIITMLFIMIGLPSQIIKNYRTKSTKGLSVLFFIMSFLTWCSWSAFGYLANSIFMAVAQGLGAIMTFIIMMQFIIYKKNPGPKIDKESVDQQIGAWMSEGGK